LGIFDIIQMEAGQAGCDRRVRALPEVRRRDILRKSLLRAPWEGVPMSDPHGVPSARLDVLAKVPFFEGLPKTTLARINSHVDEVEVPAGRKLTEQGTGAYEAFIVAEGVAEVQVGDEIVGETSVGELIGEIGVLHNKLRTATVTAKTPMRLLVINPRELGWLFDNAQLAERVQTNLDKHVGGSEA
jgi:CRP/FNR family transcriptional regulator, cyclic AMP receptor protein